MEKKKEEKKKKKKKKKKKAKKKRKKNGRHKPIAFIAVHSSNKTCCLGMKASRYFTRGTVPVPDTNKITASISISPPACMDLTVGPWLHVYRRQCSHL